MTKQTAALRAARALCLACGVPACLAQGSVNLGGTVDVALRSVRAEGQAATHSVASGGNAPSRLTLRITEPLDGPWSASATLDHAFAADTGSPATPTTFWDRRSTLSVHHADWGEWRLGRDFTPGYLTWARYDPFGYVGVASTAVLIQGSREGPLRTAFGPPPLPTTTVRANNTLQWWQPADAGPWEAAVMLAPGEGLSVAAGQNRIVAARLGWLAGGHGLSVAYTRSENEVTLASGDHFTDFGLGGQATWSGVKLTAAWRRFTHVGQDQRLGLLGLVWPVGSLDLKASYAQTRLRGRSGALALGGQQASLLGLGAVYALSRRTAGYGTVAWLHNDARAAYALPGGPPPKAGGAHSTGVEVGMRHTF